MKIQIEQSNFTNILVILLKLEIFTENIVERGEIASQEQFLLLSTIFYYLMLDFYVKKGPDFLFEITVSRDNRSRDNKGRL